MPIILPTTFNVDKCVDAPWKVVKPETFNADNKVTLLLKFELPLTLNIPLIVVLFARIVKPETFNADNKVTLLLKFELPLTFNIPLIVVLLFNFVKPETFNDDNIVVSLYNLENPLTFKLIVFKFENPVIPLIIPNILVVVLLRFVINNVLVEDKLFKLFLVSLRLKFIAVTSIGVGGSPLPLVNAVKIPLIPNKVQYSLLPLLLH